MKKISGCAIIKDNKLFLLKKFKNNYYEFPGGKVSKDEDIKEAAVRECLEEVGVNPIIVKEFGPYIFEHKNKDVKSFVFLSTTSEEPVILEKNIFEKSIWIDLDEPITIILAKNVSMFLDEYLV